MTFLFVDTETTGLDPTKHEVWELAYAVDNGPVRSSFLSHSFARAVPASLEIGNHAGRYVAPTLPDEMAFTGGFLHAGKGATFVAANATFDHNFLVARWQLDQDSTPWHRRLLDIQGYAAGVLGLPVEPVPGLRDLVDLARGLGFTIPEPDHTAAADVETLRALFWAVTDTKAANAVRLGGRRG